MLHRTRMQADDCAFRYYTYIIDMSSRTDRALGLYTVEGTGSTVMCSSGHCISEISVTDIPVNT